MTKPDIVSLIGQVAATNYTSHRGMVPTHTTLHHIVGDAQAAINRFKTPEADPRKRASSTFVIGSDGTIYQMLELSAWPYTDGNGESNRRSITVEHAGGHPNVPYTEAMYESAVHLQAWLRDVYNIPEHNIQLHRDVSDAPTACPGGLDTERIKRESSTLLNKGGDVEEKLNQGDVVNYFNAMFGYPPSENDFNYASGRTHKQQIYAMLESGDFKGAAKFFQLKRELEAARKRIAELESESPNEAIAKLSKIKDDLQEVIDKHK